MEEVFENDQKVSDEMLIPLVKTGYSEVAARYYIEKPHMGFIADADQTAEFIGSCGDTMTIYLNFDGDTIKEVKYEVMGCAGAVSAAMAAVDLIKGKTLDDALVINDGDVFNVLENIPEKKHHCIQLAVKTMHKGIEEYKAENSI